MARISWPPVIAHAVDIVGSYVLVRMLVPVEHRAREQVAEFFARANVMADKDERGVHVSASNLRRLIEQLDAEADRLFGLDDPIAPVFEAWSESLRLAERVAEMEPGYVV
jgi:hypothetical protein